MKISGVTDKEFTIGSPYSNMLGDDKVTRTYPIATNIKIIVFDKSSNTVLEEFDF
jgi:hypothetical protein